MSQPLYADTFTNETGIIYAGQMFISLSNLGDEDGTLTFKDNKGNITGTVIFPAGQPFYFPARKDNQTWGRVDIDATFTTIQAIFDNPNTERIK